MTYKKISYIILVVVALLTALSLHFASKLKFDYNFDNFFPKGDPELAYYLDFREKFGNDNDYILIGLDHSPTVFDKHFLQKVDSLTSYLQKQKHVEAVLSPTTVKSPVIEQFGYFEIPYLHVDEPERYELDSTLVYSTPELIGTLFSEDATAVSLFVQTTDNLSKEASDTLIANLKFKLEQLNLPDHHIAGKALAQSVFIEQMKFELAAFMSASVVLVVIFLWLTFRNIWGVLVPLLIVLLSVIWSLGAMGLFGKPIDIMTVLLPTIIFVVGMSDVIHLLSRYLTELTHGTPKLTAIKITIREVGLATLLTSLTTAVGFLTLLTTAIVPIRNFGLYTAISIGLAFVLAFTVLPALLVLLNKPDALKAKSRSLSWPIQLRKMLQFVLRKPTLILYSSIVVTLVSLAGISLIKVDTTLLEDLGDDDPIILDFKYFEQKFSGVRPFEIHLVAASGKKLYDKEVLQEIEKLEQYLKSDAYGLNFINSPGSIVKTIQRARSGGMQNQYKLPETEREFKQVNKQIAAFRNRSELRSVISVDGKEGRLSGKMSDIGSAQATILNDSLRAFIQTEIDSTLLKTRLTGSALLLDKNNTYVTMNMLQGLLIAFGVIALIVGLIFQSLRMVLLSLVPNIIPLLMIGGIMGYLGINLTVTISIIFTIAFGIAVDDTIHFLSKLKLELTAGKSLPYAIKRTFISAGKAIIITSIILMGGFMTLLMSGFDGTYYVGLFVSLTLLFAVAADLLLLPVLLLYFYKPRKKQGLIQ